MHVTTTCSGQFCCVVNEGAENEVNTGWFDNLILDQGLRIFASNNMSFTGGQWPGSKCYIGTSGVAPAPNQTQLLGPITSADRSTYVMSNPDSSNGYELSATMSFVFTKGQVIGNMAEIGVGWDRSINNLFSRTLIVDSNGNPTTLTLTDIDQLTVYYKITMQQDLSVYSGVLTLGSTNYPYTVRRYNLTSQVSMLYSDFNTMYRGSYCTGVGAYGFYSSSAGTTNAQFLSTLGDARNRVPYAVYSNAAGQGNIGQYGITFTYTPSADGFSGTTTVTMGPDWFLGPTTDIKPINYLITQQGSSLGWLWLFDTPIPKTSTNTLTLSFTHSWVRA